ncbi:restriction endonuclease subunit S [Xanthomonas campestris]|uniref:restriction endonuclease subunit S n=1 Tax=Xanthomonas campestris TaxID=339 RepID=UPI000E0EAEBA|nr:restriction endonuclease subunit S [Xanthomonas campestris]
MRSKSEEVIAKQEQDALPELRFAEFKKLGAWKERRLGEVISFQAGFPFASAKFSEKRVGLRLIRNRDLRSNEKAIFYSGDFEDCYVVGDGDVLIGMDGDFTPHIWSAGRALLNQRVGRIATTEECNLDFAYYLLSLHLKEVEHATAKTTVKHLSHSDVENIEAPLPVLVEQHKIAGCLSSVDACIGAEIRKLDVLKAHKQGLMQQLFPAESQHLPSLRFRGFAGRWDEVALSSQVELVSGQHLAPDQYSIDGEIPYFTGPSDYSNSLNSVPKWTASSKNIGRKGDTLITVKGSGVGELLHLKLEEVALGRQLMAVRPIAADGDFVFQFLLTQRKRLVSLAAGNLIPGLSRGDILGLPVLVPEREEQRKIGEFLASLDALIDNLSLKVTMLQQHKRGLMHGLFPVIEAHAP